MELSTSDAQSLTASSSLSVSASPEVSASPAVSANPAVSAKPTVLMSPTVSSNRAPASLYPPKPASSALTKKPTDPEKKKKMWIIIGSILGGSALLAILITLIVTSQNSYGCVAGQGCVQGAGNLSVTECNQTCADAGYQKIYRCLEGACTEASTGTGSSLAICESNCRRLFYLQSFALKTEAGINKCNSVSYSMLGFDTFPLTKISLPDSKIDFSAADNQFPVTTVIRIGEQYLGFGDTLSPPLPVDFYPAKIVDYQYALTFTIKRYGTDGLIFSANFQNKTWYLWVVYAGGICYAQPWLSFSTYNPEEYENQAKDFLGVIPMERGLFLLIK